MTAIILAAGIGSRLKEITTDKPKCMIHVNGKCIIDYQIEALLAAGIDSIYVVAGYHAQLLADHIKTRYSQSPKLKTVENTAYKTTNNMYSLYLCSKAVSDTGVIVMNGDVVFDSAIMTELMRVQTSAVCVDVGGYHEESMKVVVNPGEKFISHIAKTVTREVAQGSSIDVYRFDAKDWATLTTHITDVIENRKRLNDWTEVAIDDLAKTARISMASFDIKRRLWYEIDNIEDLTKAEMMFGRIQIPWNTIKVAFVDLDGTLYRGKHVIEGADRFVSELRRKVPSVYFLSNNSSKSHEDYQSRLAECGIAADTKDVILSSDGLGRYLQNAGVSKAFIMGTKSLARVLARYGVHHVEDKPQAVVIGYDTELTYAKLAKTALLLQQPGMPYIATHTDVVCPVENGSIPDIGSMIALLQRATGRAPERTFGKPNPDMVQWVHAQQGLKGEESIFFGDRVYTDYAMAEAINAYFVGVLTGESKRVDYESMKNAFVFPSVNEVFE